MEKWQEQIVNIIYPSAGYVEVGQVIDGTTLRILCPHDPRPPGRGGKREFLVKW